MQLRVSILYFYDYKYLHKLVELSTNNRFDES